MILGVDVVTLQVHEKYDLKGSTHGRTASEKEVSKGVRTIFKDNDFLEKRLRDGTAFNIGADVGPPFGDVGPDPMFGDVCRCPHRFDRCCF